ncbi:hypothetical protein QUF90_06020 [Desulfococcaceae bacterium HSG9]|nr:hypothetical protein [Desulfococcaceae bacterium HSG9]
MSNKNLFVTCQKNTDTVIEKFEQHFQAKGMPIPNRHEINDVVLICASGRGGSSLLFRELARSKEMLSPRGEHVPFERLYLPSIGSIDSDFLGTSDCTNEIADKIWKPLYFDLGIGLGSESEPKFQSNDEKGYLLSLEMRFALQWPGSIYPGDVRNFIKHSDILSRSHYAPKKLFSYLLEQFDREGKLHAGYYDNDPLIEQKFKSPSQPSPPNDRLIIESPPFIPILRRTWPQRDMIHRLPLLLKATLNAYRLEFLRKFFPRAHFKIIHLTRNPAASINGLIDGWLHWGFFSHNFKDQQIRLKIKGYSDRFPWGRYWWNFDLFEGWQDALDLPLEHICMYQWLNSHKHILSFKDKLNKDKFNNISWLQIRFEDLLNGREKRQKTYDQITNFLEINRLEAGSGRFPRGKVMTTAKPRPARWRDRATQILPLLENPELYKISKQLGYDVKQRLEWI